VICRFGHRLHNRNSTLVRHSKTGKTWTRCLICHAERQRKVRGTTMTKLISLRVTLAVDDVVDLKDVKPRLVGLISAGGTENIGENGITGGGRVHWATVEVLQGPDRGAVRGSKGKRVAGGKDDGPTLGV
jgi:hypothetical protein